MPQKVIVITHSGVLLEIKNSVSCFEATNTIFNFFSFNFDINNVNVKENTHTKESMNLIKSSHKILRGDFLMNRKQNRQMWNEVVATQKKSGQTQNKWCKENNVNIHTFRYWVGRLNRTAQIEPSSAPIWAAVTPESIRQPSTSLLKVVLGNVTIEIEKGFDAGLLKDVIKALSYHVE